MRLRASLVVGLVIITGSAGVPQGEAQSAYDLVAACRAQGGSERMCTAMHQTLRVPGGLCRDASSDHPECKRIDGIDIRRDLVAAHESSWLARALALQRELDDDRPLHDEMWAHTHNSYNADAYAPTFYGQDRNHIYTVEDQLRMGIRAIEIDLHWAPSTSSAGEDRVVVCHGNEDVVPTPFAVHLGCGVNDPSLGQYLAEIAGWLDDNPEEVLLVYLENSLDGVERAHDEVARDVAERLGHLVYKPATGCASLPMEATRREIRESGKRVLLAGNCGPGAWGDWVHVRGADWKERGLEYGDDVPHYPCTDEYTARPRDFIRRWGDETGVSAGAGEGGDVTVTDARNMVRCGVNMPGLDNVVPFDERLEQFIWSWAPGEPSQATNGWCASLEADGRFHTAPCSPRDKTVEGSDSRPDDRRPFACLVTGDWQVTERANHWAHGDDACAQIGGTFSVPRSGYENERLKQAASRQDRGVWLNYRASGGRWLS